LPPNPQPSLQNTVKQLQATQKAAGDKKPKTR
jgi:hypothetical protein